MSQSKEQIQFAIDTLAAETAQKYAAEKQIAETEALRFLIGTNTYKLLRDAQSYLYLESMEYVMDMLSSELSGDTEKWIEA
jgi:hypothetical protein